MPSNALADPPRRIEPSNRVRQRVENVRIAVPRVDWASVRCFEKCMWRSYSRRLNPLSPQPVILYSEHPTTGVVETVVAWLIETRQEPAAAISDADLEQEGFDSRSAFKRYFAERYPKGGFRPLELVQVYRVAPLTEEARVEWLDALWDRLYGNYA